MIRFEKDNYIMYFEDADAAAKWLAKENDVGGQFEDLINEVYDNFGRWVNHHWTAYDILCELHHLNGLMSLLMTFIITLLNIFTMKIQR